MIQRSDKSAYTQEMAKWEQRAGGETFRSEWVVGDLKPGRPYVYEQYPMMLYKAQRTPGSGKWAVSLPEPARHAFRDQDEWDQARIMVSNFNASCTKTVKDEDEHLKARGQGWCDTPPKALEQALREENRVADETGERNYRDRNMSPAAKAEIEAHERDNFGHQPEIPAKPLPAKRKKVAAKKAAAPPAV